MFHLKVQKNKKVQIKNATVSFLKCFIQPEHYLFDMPGWNTSLYHI